MNILKTIALVGLTLIVMIAVVLGTMRLGWWNPSYEKAKSVFATPPSKFVEVGDVTLHVRDEGEGPVVIMLHSSMSNLTLWDHWADRLKENYRVIRFDWPPYGLSVDPEPSTGMQGVVSLFEAFIEQEGLDEFTLIGSSSGATVSVLYTAAHPEKVRALALSTLPLKAPPNTKFSSVSTAMIWLHQHVIPNYNSRYYYRKTLEELYGRPERLTEEAIDLFYYSGNIPGGFRRVGEYYQANRKAVWANGAGNEAAEVMVPILLQWGDMDPVLPVSMAADAVADFANADIEIIHYPDTGHYPMIEIPNETADDLEAFLAKVHSPEKEEAQQ
jgi:pimeloyl-ACP methyl ester carboxylesterase